MTSPSSGRLLISHIILRGPELRQTYALIAREPAITYARLAEQTLAPAERSIGRYTGGGYASPDPDRSD